MATMIFCHGKESGPLGYKISRLRPLAERRGWQVISPDFRDLDDPDARVERLLDLKPSISGPSVLIGSSMGGYVAARASAELKPSGLLLLAPAIGLDGYTDSDPAPVADQLEVVHGWRDEIIAPRVVFDWCRRHQLALHMVDDEHPLNQSLTFLQQRLELMFDAVNQPLAL